MTSPRSRASRSIAIDRDRRARRGSRVVRDPRLEVRERESRSIARRAPDDEYSAHGGRTVLAPVRGPRRRRRRRARRSARRHAGARDDAPDDARARRRKRDATRWTRDATEVEATTTTTTTTTTTARDRVRATND